MAEIMLVDCYGPLDLAQMKALKATGVMGIAGYLGRKSMGYNKAMTPQSVQDAISLGFVMISVWEGNSTHVGYFTRQQGIVDATHAIEDAKWLGQPEGSAIYFAVDYDCQNSDMPAIRSYFEGARSVLGNKYKLGIYGGARALNNVSVDYYWQTIAWSGGVTTTRTDMKQTEVNTYRCGISVDIDIIYKESGQWPVRGAAEVKPSEPAPVKRVAPVEYKTIKVELDGKAFTDGIVVGDSTYVVWTALLKFNTPHNYRGNGVMEVGGKEIKGVVYKGDTYLPWTAIASGIKAKSISGGFNFFVEASPVIVAKPVEAKPAPATTKPVEKLPQAIVLKGKYPAVKVELNGKSFNDGVVYNNSTYVMWTALETFKTPHAYKGNGVMNVDGKDIQGVIYGPDTYLPWDCLAKNIKPVHINGGWNFQA